MPGPKQSALRAQLGYVKITGGIPCPRCDEDSRVVDTAWSTVHGGTLRRRKCRACARIFYTVEKQVDVKATPPRP